MVYVMKVRGGVPDKCLPQVPVWLSRAVILHINRDAIYVCKHVVKKTELRLVSP